MKIKIFCDSADLATIRKFNKNLMVSGFTTNPSLMKIAGAKNYKNYSLKLLNICKKNSNEKYKDWKKEIYEVAIIGSSCIHTNIVKKKFDEDIVKISSGGPISSDPIFIGQSEAGELNFEIIF